MTFVGKILVVLQLVLAICFMAFAGAVYSTQTNWKTAAENAKKDADQQRSAATTAANELQQVRTDLGAQLEERNQNVAILEGKLKESTDQLARTQQELQEARTAVDRQTAVANLSEEQATFRQEETLRQRERNERLQAQINDLLGQVRGLEDTLFSKNLQIEDMEARQQRMIEQVGQYRQMILALNGSLNPDDYEVLTEGQEPPPSVTGQVLNTRVSDTSKTEFVEVSLGSDDGFKKGDELFVYRGADYLGKLEISTVYPDRSVGRVTQRVRNGTIQKGDNVTPKL